MLKDYISEIINICGPRIAGSESDKKAINHIKKIMSGFCDKVDVEDFEVAPRLLQRLIEMITYAVVATFITFFISPVISLLIGVVFITIFFLSRWYDIEIINRFMKKEKTANLVGIIKPSGKIKRRLIVSGHHDSAFNMVLLHRQYVWLTPIIELFTSISIIVMLFLSVYAMSKGKWLYPFIPTKLWIWAVLTGFIGVIASQIMRKGLTGDVPVDGANDNLSGVVVAIGLAEYLSKNRPVGTEVMCVSFGAEEPNTKGSQAFVKKHIQDLKSLPTYLLNFDMVGEDGTLRIIKRELEVKSTHSKSFVNLVGRAAEDNKIASKQAILPFGNTDATSFSRKGLQATSIIRVDSKGLPGHWHSTEDTIDNIKEQPLSESLSLAKAVLTTLESQE